MLQSCVAEGKPRSDSQVVSLAVQDGGVQVLRVDVRIAGSFGGERFLARMTKDGRLTIPKLTLKLLQEGEEGGLEGSVLEVTIEPADEQGEKPEPNP